MTTRTPAQGDIVELFCGEKDRQWGRFPIDSFAPETGEMVIAGCRRHVSGEGSEWRWPKDDPAAACR